MKYCLHFKIVVFQLRFAIAFFSLRRFSIFPYFSCIQVNHFIFPHVSIIAILRCY